MSDISAEMLEYMSQVDIRTVNPDTLVDIRDVKVNHNLPKKARIIDFIGQIKNPYCFKHGKVIVKIGFSETESTFEDKYESYLRSI